MTDHDWDSVIESASARQAYNVCRAAIALSASRTKVRSCSSPRRAGCIGNIGQANYAAAKMGIAGLSRIIAMEGAQKNVRSNVIAPFAWTRMIATIPVKDEASAKRVERMKNMMRADQVAQLAVALASSPATKEVSGQIFAAPRQRDFPDVAATADPRDRQGRGWSPETIAEHAMPALKPSFFDLGATTSVFGWDPI